MDHVAEFARKYSQDLSKDVLLHKNFAKDLTRISREFGNLEPKQRREIEQVLEQVLSMIEASIKTLSEDAQEAKRTIKASQENANACVAYLNALRGGAKS